MKLRNKKSYFTAMPQDKPAKSVKSRIVSIAYFALLVLIGLYLLYFMVGLFLYEQGEGQVEIASYKLHASGSGLISQLALAEGDKVSAGQILLNIKGSSGVQPSMLKDKLKVERDLARLEADLGQAEKSLALINKISQRDMVGDRLLAPQYAVALPVAAVKVQNNIVREKAHLQLLHSQRLDLNADLGVIASPEAERILELSRMDRNQQAQTQQQFQKINYSITSQVAEVGSLQRYFKQLVEMEKSALLQKTSMLRAQRQGLIAYQEGLQSGAGVAVNDMVLESPVAGRVSAVFCQNGDMVKVGDVLAAVTVPHASVTIHGYFNIKQLASLQQGDMVKVLFPDGKKSQGVIVTMHSASAPYLNKIKDGYLPIESPIFVEISPENRQEAGLWKQYDRMDVELKVRQ